MKDKAVHKIPEQNSYWHMQSDVIAAWLHESKSGHSIVTWGPVHAFASACLYLLYMGWKCCGWVGGTTTHYLTPVSVNVTLVYGSRLHAWLAIPRLLSLLRAPTITSWLRACYKPAITLISKIELFLSLFMLFFLSPFLFSGHGYI